MYTQTSRSSEDLKQEVSTLNHITHTLEKLIMGKNVEKKVKIKSVRPDLSLVHTQEVKKVHNKNKSLETQVPSSDDERFIEL